MVRIIPFSIAPIICIQLNLYELNSVSMNKAKVVFAVIICYMNACWLFFNSPK